MWNFRRLALLSSCFPLIMIISTTLLKGFPLILSLKALFPFHSLNSRESMQLISTFFFFRFVSFADLKLNRPLCTWTKSPIHSWQASGVSICFSSTWWHLFALLYCPERKKPKITCANLSFARVWPQFVRVSWVFTSSLPSLVCVFFLFIPPECEFFFLSGCLKVAWCIA